MIVSAATVFVVVFAPLTAGALQGGQLPFRAFSRFRLWPQGSTVSAASENVGLLDNVPVNIYRDEFGGGGGGRGARRPSAIALDVHVGALQLSVRMRGEPRGGGSTRLFIGENRSMLGDDGGMCVFIGTVSAIGPSDLHPDNETYSLLLRLIGDGQVLARLHNSKVEMNLCDGITGSIRMRSAKAFYDFVVLLRTDDAGRNVARFHVDDRRERPTVRLDDGDEGRSHTRTHYGHARRRQSAVLPSRLADAAPVGEIELALFLDESFVDRCFGGNVANAVSRAETIIALANTLLTKIGITIVVPLIYTFSAATGMQPWPTADTHDAIFNNFDNYFLSHYDRFIAALPHGSALDAGHLITCEAFGGGIACLDCICDALPATGVTEYIERIDDSRRLDFAYRILAHEIGHNLFAIHDDKSPGSSASGCGYTTCPCNSRSTCADNNCIMYSVVDGKEENWSRCSEEQSQMTRLTFANNGSCLQVGAAISTSCPSDLLDKPIDEDISLEQCSKGEGIAVLALASDAAVTARVDADSMSDGFDVVAADRIVTLTYDGAAVAAGSSATYLVTVSVSVDQVPDCHEQVALRITLHCPAMCPAQLFDKAVGGGNISLKQCASGDGSVLHSFLLTTNARAEAILDVSSRESGFDLGALEVNGAVTLVYNGVGLAAGSSATHSVTVSVSVDEPRGCTDEVAIEVKLHCPASCPIDLFEKPVDDIALEQCAAGDGSVLLSLDLSTNMAASATIDSSSFAAGFNVSATIDGVVDVRYSGSDVPPGSSQVQSINVTVSVDEIDGCTEQVMFEIVLRCSVTCPTDLFEKPVDDLSIESCSSDNGNAALMTLGLATAAAAIATVDATSLANGFDVGAPIGGVVELRYAGVAIAAGSSATHSVKVMATLVERADCTDQVTLAIVINCPAISTSHCPTVVMTDAVERFWTRSLGQKSCYLFVRSGLGRPRDVCAAVQLTGAGGQYAYKAIIDSEAEHELLLEKIRNLSDSKVPKFFELGIEHQPGAALNDWSFTATGRQTLAWRCFFGGTDGCFPAPFSVFVSPNAVTCAFLFNKRASARYWGTAACSLTKSFSEGGYICEYPLDGNVDGDLLPRPDVDFGTLSPSEIEALYTAAGTFVDI